MVFVRKEIRAQIARNELKSASYIESLGRAAKKHEEKGEERGVHGPQGNWPR